MSDDLLDFETFVDVPPPGWVAVNLDPEFDADEYALAVHRFLAEDVELAGGRVDASAVDAASSTLAFVTRWARDTVNGRGGFAYAWIGDPQRPTAVWLDVWARPEDEFTAWAEERFSREIPEADPRCSTSTVELPAGPAVRIRSVVAPDDPARPVTEGVDVLVRPRDAPGRVVISSGWVELADGDRWAALVDEFAATVRVRQVPPGS